MKKYYYHVEYFDGLIRFDTPYFKTVKELDEYIHEKNLEDATLTLKTY